ncbi:unnamed protein product [Linum trigynum]|uniref:Uncharacterized protein n=1 Tax=Linum trigynum TaxID=586398 RepID=A0AAV2CBX8_9ROSI
MEEGKREATNPETIKGSSLETNQSDFEELKGRKTPLFLTKNEDKDPLLSRAIQLDSTQFSATETSREILGMCRSNQFISKKHQSKTPKLKIFGRKFEEEKKASIGDMGSDSNPFEVVDELLEVQGRYKSHQLDEKMAKLKTPNSSFGSPETGFPSPESGFWLPDSGNFEFPNGGKISNPKLQRLELIRRSGMVFFVSWDPGKSIVCNELDRGSREAKSPNVEHSPEFLPALETEILGGRVLGSILQNFCVGKVHWRPTNVMRLKSWQT